MFLITETIFWDSVATVAINETLSTNHPNGDIDAVQLNDYFEKS